MLGLVSDGDPGLDVRAFRQGPHRWLYRVDTWCRQLSEFRQLRVGVRVVLSSAEAPTLRAAQLTALNRRLDGSQRETWAPLPSKRPKVWVRLPRVFFDRQRVVGPWRQLEWSWRSQPHRTARCVARSPQARWVRNPRSDTSASAPRTLEDWYFGNPLKSSSTLPTTFTTCAEVWWPVLMKSIPTGPATPVVSANTSTANDPDGTASVVPSARRTVRSPVGLSVECDGSFCAPRVAAGSAVAGALAVVTMKWVK